MTIAGSAKAWVNGFLAPWNARLISLTEERLERARLAGLAANGHFDRAVFPLLRQFECCSPDEVQAWLPRYRNELSEFEEDTQSESNRYQLANEYFTSPDAEVAYSIVRELRPRRVVEVGSGNSTRLFRSAIAAGRLSTELVSVDPNPRREIASIADRVYRCKLEDLPEDFLISQLAKGDVLFVDSSHRVDAANDVVTLLLGAVPRLQVGVLVHLHDIFLPYEYPREWLVDLGWRWNEQYLVQALLQDSTALEVLWAGHYFQRTQPGFRDQFPAMKNGRASSLWLRKVS